MQSTPNAMEPFLPSEHTPSQAIAPAPGDSLPQPPAPAANPFQALIYLLLALFVATVLRCAWLSDDAFISFRTVYNFVNGHGLTWNVGERVQSFTHPLWLFCMVLNYVPTHDLYHSIIASGVICSLATLLVLQRRLALTPAHALVAVALLVSSKAFVDYSTSGLENPLTHLLLVVFWAAYYADEARIKGGRTLFWLSLIAALATLNRMDTVLLYLPALALQLYRHRSVRALGPIALGFLPFILWEIFSVIYYGFPFPNTAYAKLGLGAIVSQKVMIKQGYFYLLQSLDIDPLTMIAIGAGLLAVLFEKRWRDMPLMLGTALYLLYVVRIGGDFMSGRMLTVVLLGAVILIVRSRAIQPSVYALAGVAAIFTIGLIAPKPTLLSRSDYWSDREEARKTIMSDKLVADERGFYYQLTGMLKESQILPMPAIPPMHIEKVPVSKCGKKVIQGFGLGYNGSIAGPDVYIIDHFALCDPLLARLPPAPYSRGAGWRPGHNERTLPAGYMETITNGVNSLADPNLRIFYDKLCLITRGPICSWPRLVAIVQMNLGLCEHLLPKS